MWDGRSVGKGPGGVDTVMHKRLHIYPDLLFAKIKGKKKKQNRSF